MAPKDLELQVAGHKGVQTDDSGELVFKPALPTEIAFYAHVQQDAALAPLRAFTPTQYGTLVLQGEEDGAGGVRQTADAGSESIVLENLTYGYAHASVLDAKLGTVLYAPDASEEKKQRMIKKAAETTTGQVGLRLTGCQTWHAPTGSYIATPRQFGYDLKVPDMPAALARFFPLPSETVAEYIDPTPAPVDPAAAAEPVPPLAEPQSPIPREYTDHAIPLPLLRRLLETLLGRLGKLKNALEACEIRAVGASLLVVYEGDPGKLAEAFDALDGGRAKWKEDAEIDPDGDSDDEDGARLPLTLHLIDFAHTVPAPGRGPDAGVLRGLDKFAELVRGRLETVERELEKEGGGREAKKPKTA